MINFKIYDAVSQLPKEWNALAVPDIFLNTSYLKAFESAAPETISLYYIGIYSDDLLVGIVIVQRIKLYAKDMFRSEWSSKWTTTLKDWVSKSLKGTILVIGNLTHTGQHGFYFDSKVISQMDFLSVLFDGIDALKVRIKKQEDKSIRAIMFKDYFPTDAIHEAIPLFLARQFYKASVQPNMILHLNPEWKQMTDYVGALTKKYKTRYKRARLKLCKIKAVELNESDVNRYSERMYGLYMNVSKNASFNTFVLPKDHFLKLKMELKDNFRLFGYFLDEELMGFYTLILNNDALETYFLGYDPQHQTQHQLYLNMLYDMILFGIDNNFESIVFARTAMEIKSSVGAAPQPMSIYIKHTNKVVNSALKSIFRLMDPEQVWEERHPFKNMEKS